MHGLKKILIQEQKYLEDVIRKAKVDKTAFPEGYLRISKDRGYARFYQCIDDRYGTYIPKDKTLLPKQLAQKAYLEAVVRKAEIRLEQISDILQDYSDDEIEQVYLSLHVDRQSLITPIEPTEE